MFTEPVVTPTPAPIPIPTAVVRCGTNTVFDATLSTILLCIKEGFNKNSKSFKKIDIDKEIMEQ